MAGEADIAALFAAQTINMMIQAMGNVASESYADLVQGSALALYDDLQRQLSQLAVVNDVPTERRTAARAQATDYAVATSVSDMIGVAMGQVDLATAQAISDIGKVYLKTYNQRWRSVVSINQEVGRIAIQDMVEHFDQVYAARHSGGGPPSGYRQNSRYSGGLLRSALSSPLQATATIDGVLFGDTALLDATARHWARLNFGAGPRAGKPGGSQPYMLTEYGTRLSPSSGFFSEALGLSAPTVSLPYRAKGTFTMPAGVFSNDGTTKNAVAADPMRRGQDAFYPRSRRSKNRQDVIVTQGVEAWGFIEAGVASVNKNLGAANRDFLLSIFDEAERNTKSIVFKAIPTITPQRMSNARALLDF